MPRSLIVAFAFLFLLTLKVCPAQNIEGSFSFIHTPAELSQWLTKGFKYEMEIPNRWQAAEETLNLKKGDCEDFAVLAQSILAGMGIDSSVLLIKFKGLKVFHAVCVFKDKRGYSFFSNQELVGTKAGSITAAVEEIYPDYEKIIFLPNFHYRNFLKQ